MHLSDCPIGKVVKRYLSTNGVWRYGHIVGFTLSNTGETILVVQFAQYNSPSAGIDYDIVAIHPSKVDNV